MKFFAVFICNVILLYSCSEHEDLALSNKVFRYNQPNAITSLDPAFTKTQNNIWAVNQLYNGLVRLNDSLTILPSVAKSWEISENGMKYVFRLRDDVFFHDDKCFSNEKGRKVVASDFVFSFKRLNDAKVNSPGSWLFSEIADSTSFIAINDTTFEIHLKKSFIPILGMLTMQYCSVVPKEAVQFYGKEFRSHPVGTGPYKFKRWIEDQALFLQKNDHYFESTAANPLPKMDYIKTSFIPDKQIAMLELLSGKTDFIAGIESSFVNELLTKDGQLQEDKKGIIQFVKTPYLNHEYFGINQDLAKKSNALSNKKIRQALNFAIDKKMMLATLKNNIGIAANAGFVPRGLPSFNDSIVKGYSYNITKANQLLAEAGHEHGKGLDEIELHTNNEYLDICTFVAKQWEKIGIRTKISVDETAILREGMRKSNIPMFRASWIADYPDAESFLCMFYSKNPAPPNYTRFANKEFDALYELAIKETNTETRYRLYQEMDKIIVEEAPVIFLFYDESSVFINQKLTGYTNNGINLLNIKNIRK